jgi:hypothetical protein
VQQVRQQSRAAAMAAGLDSFSALRARLAAAVAAAAPVLAQPAHRAASRRPR